MRGKALEEAEAWARDKSLSYQDRQFLAASKEQEIQAEIAAKEKEAALERERQDREAALERERQEKEAAEYRNKLLSEANAEYRNKLLSEANQKAKKQIRNGTIILIFTVLVAVISVILAGKEVKEAQQKLKETYNYVAYPQQLRELVSKLPSNSEAAKLISKQADIKIKDDQIEQVYLHAAKALAYQYLNDSKSAEESIKQSMNFLRGWQQNREGRGSRESNSEFLETQIFALNIKGKLLSKQGNVPEAIETYKEVFSIIEKHPQISSSQAELTKIIDSKVIESIYRGLIELISENNTESALRKKVEPLLTQNLYAQLEHSLKTKDWEAADEQTNQLMLYIAKREKELYLDDNDINNFSCPDLQRIDKLWVTNSDNRFGFSVQKEIWDKNPENYISFAKAVGWYDDKANGGDFVSYDELLRRIKDNPDTYRGSLPLRALSFTIPLYTSSNPSLSLRLAKCSI